MRKLVGYLCFKTKDLSARQPIWLTIISEDIILGPSSKRKIYMFKLFTNFSLSAMHYQENATMIGFLRDAEWQGKVIDSTIIRNNFLLKPVYKVSKFYSIECYKLLLRHLEEMQTRLKHNSVLKFELKYPHKELKKLIMQMKSVVML